MRYAWQTFKMVLSEAQARGMIDRFFATYPGLLDWHETARRQARRDGAVANPFGRVRHLPWIRSSDRQAASRAERQAINAPVQSTLSDLTCWAFERDRPPDPRSAALRHDPRRRAGLLPRGPRRRDRPPHRRGRQQPADRDDVRLAPATPLHLRPRIRPRHGRDGEDEGSAGGAPLQWRGYDQESREWTSRAPGMGMAHERAGATGGDTGGPKGAHRLAA